MSRRFFLKRKTSRRRWLNLRRSARARRHIITMTRARPATIPAALAGKGVRLVCACGDGLASSSPRAYCNIDMYAYVDLFGHDLTGRRLAVSGPNTVDYIYLEWGRPSVVGR